MMLSNNMTKSGRKVLRLSTSLYSTISSRPCVCGGFLRTNSRPCVCVYCSSSYLSATSSRRFSTKSSRPCVGGSSYISIMSKDLLSLFKRPKGFWSLFNKSSKGLVNTLSVKTEAILMNPEISPLAKVTSLRDLVERLSKGKQIELMNAYWKKDSSLRLSLNELLNAYWIKYSPWVSRTSFFTSFRGLVDASLHGNTNEPIKGIAILDFVIRCDKILPELAFDPYDNKDKFMLKFDNKGVQITVYVSEKEQHKEHLKALVVDDIVVVVSTETTEVCECLEIIELPQFISYDPDQVIGSIIDGGDLKISFPYSEEKTGPSAFQINLV